jgi:uncharacterized membrane protein YdbT with pleckstrin-like domain
MFVRHRSPALTLVLISATCLLAISLIGALLWLGLPWSVLGLILATIAVILSVAQQKAA